MFEIAYSKHSRNKVKNVVTPLAGKYAFSYQSKYGDLKNARKQLWQLLHNLNEDELEISLSDASKIPSNKDVDREISIALVFELNNLEKLPEIVQTFQSFAVFLDSISQK